MNLAAGAAAGGCGKTPAAAAATAAPPEHGSPLVVVPLGTSADKTLSALCALRPPETPCPCRRASRNGRVSEISTRNPLTLRFATVGIALQQAGGAPRA
jgi:hypothetical protein